MLFNNQSAMGHNILEPDDMRELLTEDAVELRATPPDLFGYRSAIMGAMAKGTN